MARLGHAPDQRLLDLQRRGLRGVEIGKWILEQRLNPLDGTHVSRVISMGAAAASSERTKLVAAVKSPYE